MSGYKRATITIGQEEYDRLREAETKLRSLPSTSAVDYSHIIEKSNAALRDNISKLQNRQTVLDHAISGVDDAIREIETATSQRILNVQHQLSQETQQYSGCLWENVNQVLDQQSAQFNQQISVVYESMQKDMLLYARRMRRVLDDQEQKRSLANDWLNAAEQLRNFIDQQYDHEMLLPGKVDRLDQHLAQARQNLEYGLSEAVIVTSQQLYSAFSEMRVELERLLAEWNILLQTTWEAVCQLLVITERSKTVEAVDLDGNPLQFSIDVEFWSNGRISQLFSELSSMKERLEDDRDPLATTTLERWLSLDLQSYEQALSDIVLDARVTALNSQLRINIADLVVRALQDQGFALDRSDYEGSDQRMTYDARLSAMDGSEVVVKVSPSGSELGQNELQLQSLDRELRTERELQQRWSEVSRSLSFYGLDIGSVVREEAPAYRTNTSEKPSTSYTIQQKGAR